MKLVLLGFLMALSGALGMVSHRGFGGSRWGGGIVSRRDAAEPAEPAAAAAAEPAADDNDEDDDSDEVPTQAQLSEAVDGFLEDAKKGMAVEQMALEAVAIQAIADAVVDSQGGEVPRDEVKKEIDDAAGSLSGVVAVSSLFDEPMDFEDSKMDAALCVLNNLNKQAQQELADGESSQSTVAAISMTAEAVQDILTEAVGIYTFIEKAAEEDEEGNKNVDKRWKFTGGYNRNAFGQNSYNAQISHEWNGRRKRDINKRGNWKGNIGVTRGPGGYGVSAGVTYTWGRR